MKKKASIKKIKAELIKSCIKSSPIDFLPFLLSDNVITGMPNKIRFYKFFKRMVLCMEKGSIGQMTYKIEQPNWIQNKNICHLTFYDEKHKYSRLTIEVGEENNKLYLNTLPF